MIHNDTFLGENTLQYRGCLGHKGVIVPLVRGIISAHYGHANLPGPVPRKPDGVCHFDMAVAKGWSQMVQALFLSPFFGPFRNCSQQRAVSWFYMARSLWLLLGRWHGGLGTLKSTKCHPFFSLLFGSWVFMNDSLMFVSFNWKYIGVCIIYIPANSKIS